MKPVDRIMVWITMLTIMGGILSSALAAPRASVQRDPQVVARLAQLLEQSGYTYRKASDNVWVVSFKGKSLIDMNLLVTSAEGLIVIGVVVASKSSMKVTPEMMFKLLRLVHDIDRVKIGFDNDEDLFLRSEVMVKCLDVASFKEQMDQVSAGADKTHAAIRSFLIK